jgi:hypothetical protein
MHVLMSYSLKTRFSLIDRGKILWQSFSKMSYAYSYLATTYKTSSKSSSYGQIHPAGARLLAACSRSSSRLIFYPQRASLRHTATNLATSCSLTYMATNLAAACPPFHNRLVTYPQHAVWWHATILSHKAFLVLIATPPLFPSFDQNPTLAATFPYTPPPSSPTSRCRPPAPPRPL